MQGKKVTYAFFGLADGCSTESFDAVHVTKRKVTRIITWTNLYLSKQTMEEKAASVSNALFTSKTNDER